MDNDEVKLKEIGFHWDGEEKVHIFLVDGNKVRNHMLINFTMGGHHYVYNRIPEDEIWLDDHNYDERAAVAEHEAHERKLMKFKNMSYSKAHDQANIVEKKSRKSNIAG